MRCAQEEINQALRLKGDVTLQAGHPPTVVVGGTKGILIIAANPGFNDELNAKEAIFRQTENGNEEFCSQFFTHKFREHVKKIPWWISVSKFAQAAYADQVHDDSLDWAATGLVGAIDLVPFHSKKDGITRKLYSTSPQGLGLVDCNS